MKCISGSIAKPYTVALRSLPCPTPLSIVVWDITDEERPVLIRQHNPQQQASAPVRSVYQDPTSVYPVPYRIPYATAPARFPNQYSSGPYHSQSPLTSIPFQPCQATYAYPQCTNTYTSGGYTDLSRHEPSAHPQHAQAYQPMHATYPLNDFNLSSNTRCASTGLQQICIQISNLAKGVREGELAQIMQSKKVNDFRSLQIARDKQTEEPRGSATATAMATFSTTHRAERAVRILDGFTFRKKVLKVKIVEERESLPAALLYPVVNGSTY